MMRELLDSIPACIVAIDKDMKVETYNRPCRELFESLGAKVSAGTDISTIFPDERVQKMLAEAVR
jgi:sensor histidine kinase regulating citrate/malate metabolism